MTSSTACSTFNYMVNRGIEPGLEQSLDLTFGALSDPTRRAIVARLAGGDATLSELAQPFEMSVPAVHKHLRVLEDAGLVASTREGRMRRCRLEVEQLREATSWIEDRRALWSGRLTGLARHLGDGQKPKRKRRKTDD